MILPDSILNKNFQRKPKRNIKRKQKTRLYNIFNIINQSVKHDFLTFLNLNIPNDLKRRMKVEHRFELTFITNHALLQRNRHVEGDDADKGERDEERHDAASKHFAIDCDKKESSSCVLCGLCLAKREKPGQCNATTRA